MQENIKGMISELLSGILGVLIGGVIVGIVKPIKRRKNLTILSGLN